MRVSLCLLLLAVVALTPAFTHAEDKTSAFFDGKDLAGWQGLDKYWSVKDGAVVGFTPADPGFNTFLCTKRKYKDFDLSFQVRLKNGIGNSGVQIRSEIFNPTRFQVKGPQADIGAGYWGSLYGEHFGGMMQAASPSLIKKVVRSEDFNDYSIHCLGKHVTIKINGTTMVDGEFPKMPDDGIIALQLHAGYPSMEVIFRNIRFKELKP